MLAALLLNLGQTPAPPPAVAPAHFGGGPFWSRYGYDIEEEQEEVIADEVVSAEIIVEFVVEPNRDVVPEPRPRPAPVVIDRIEAQARAAFAVRKEIREELSKERKLREAERALRARREAQLEAQREAARQEVLKAQRDDEEKMLIAFMEL